ncbi:MAG: glycosyltransferase, partial [Eubacterium sp.]
AKAFGSKDVYTGSPIREELFTGSKEAGLKMCGFTTDKPVILVMGGSLGSEFINKSIRDSLDILLDKYQIVHLCGRGKLDKSLNNKAGYAQFEYIKDEMKDLYAMCDLVISRAGANAICEVKALKKPSILIPLSGRASRGDQILNAGSFKKQGFSEVLYEQYLDRETLALNIDKIFDNKEQYVAALENAEGQDSINQIVNLLDECCKKPKKKKK